MCRFIAYLGEDPRQISQLLIKPNNSLVKQSRFPTEGTTRLHADGFGFGWYNRNLDSFPAVFRSVQPVWSDENLIQVASKIESNCFIGHVRSATVGDVSLLNCQPLAHRHYLFAHNGTIKNFLAMKPALYQRYNDESIYALRGQTDSEHFFIYYQQLLAQIQNPTVEDIAETLRQSVRDFIELQHQFNPKQNSFFNTVLTDGEQMVVSRELDDENDEPLSLYYCTHETISTAHSNTLFGSERATRFVLIASERLTDFSDEWFEVPLHHIMTIDKQLSIKFVAF